MKKISTELCTEDLHNIFKSYEIGVDNQVFNDIMVDCSNRRWTKPWTKEEDVRYFIQQGFLRHQYLSTIYNISVLYLLKNWDKARIIARRNDGFTELYKLVEDFTTNYGSNIDSERLKRDRAFLIVSWQNRERKEIFISYEVGDGFGYTIRPEGQTYKISAHH